MEDERRITTIAGMEADGASFRDPASVVFRDSDDGRIFRKIAPSYYDDYRLLMASGLYHYLEEEGLIVPHREIQIISTDYRVIAPEPVQMITYPYEWSFRMLKEAAIVTLEINEIAMEHGMMLKDASAYNIQWVNGRMKLIDTCSFIRYESGMPWGAYSEFLRHFVTPMLLIKYGHPDDAKMSMSYIDGIPLGLARRMLPKRAYLNFGMWAHVMSQSLNFTVNPKRSVKMSERAVVALLGNLRKFVSGMTYKTPRSGLMDYADYEYSSYTKEARAEKRDIMFRLLRDLPEDVKVVLDLGCNTGEYSVMAAKFHRKVIAVDSDHDCVDELNRKVESWPILPLVVDVCNPSPAIGWANRERRAFWDRIGEVDCVLALALVHHLCVRNNVPLRMVADLLAEHCRHLIIEWVPITDPKADLLLGRKMIPEYSEREFRRAFGAHFRIRREEPLRGSKRTIFLMEKED